MLKHNIGKYLDIGTLTPTDTMVGAEVTASEWWESLKAQMDDIIWLYYTGREVFYNKRFNPEEDTSTRDNIRRTFGIYLKSKKVIIDNLWTAYIAKYNPLWNVDGVEGYISKDTHTGTDINAHKGKDTTLTEDNGNITKSGNETIASAGTDTSIDSNTTYNSSTFFDGDKNTFNHGKTDTHTYNQVRDTHDLDGKNETTYNSSMEETRNLTDNHIDLKVRQGNIGVTKSSELLRDTLELYNDELIDFYKQVVRACINQVSYAVE